MARIVSSDLAPEGPVHYSFSDVEFDLGGDAATFETDRRDVLSNAEAHPWLNVEYDEAELIGGVWRDPFVPRDEDVLSSETSVAFDTDEIAELEQNKFHAVDNPTAIESGLDQGEVIEGARGVNLTIAADVADADAVDDTTVTVDPVDVPNEGETPSPVGPVDSTGDPNFEGGGPSAPTPDAPAETPAPAEPAPDAPAETPAPAEPAPDAPAEPAPDAPADNPEPVNPLDLPAPDNGDNF